MCKRHAMIINYMAFNQLVLLCSICSKFYILENFRLTIVLILLKEIGVL